MTTKKTTITEDKVINDDFWGHHDVYRIVSRVPARYIVWNIGENMGTDEYIPFTTMLRPDDPDCFDINRKDLLAVKLKKEEVMILRDAAHNGASNLANARACIRSKDVRKANLAKQALPIYERISTQ